MSIKKDKNITLESLSRLRFVVAALICSFWLVLIDIPKPTDGLNPLTVHRSIAIRVGMGALID